MVAGKLNGYNNVCARTKVEECAGFWKTIRLNEWIFSLSVLIFMLSVALGKLCVNYGYDLWWLTGTQYTSLSLPNLSQLYIASDTASIPTLLNAHMIQQWKSTEDLTTVSTSSTGVIANVVISVTEKLGWLMKAFVCGLTMTGFTWYIIYKDSRDPGVNPPFPFTLGKQRYPSCSGLQLNYLVGLLNGILIFLYMCL